MRTVQTVLYLAILTVTLPSGVWGWGWHHGSNSSAPSTKPPEKSPSPSETPSQAPSNEDSRVSKIRSYVSTSKIIPQAQKKQLNDALDKLSPRLSASKLKAQQTCGIIWVNVQMIMKIFGSHSQTSGENPGTENSLKILEPFLGKLGLTTKSQSCAKPGGNSTSAKSPGGTWQSFTSAFSKVKEQASSFMNGGKNANVNSLKLPLAASMAYCKFRGWQYCCPVESKCP